MEKVVVYTSTACHYCHMLKDYLKEKNVPFEERNIDTDMSAREFLIKNRIMGVPVSYIGDEQVEGFDRERIDQLLGL